MATIKPKQAPKLSKEQCGELVDAARTAVGNDRFSRFIRDVFDAPKGEKRPPAVDPKRLEGTN